jgi:hypothetical protein
MARGGLKPRLIDFYEPCSARSTLASPKPDLRTLLDGTAQRAVGGLCDDNIGAPVVLAVFAPKRFQVAARKG